MYAPAIFNERSRFTPLYQDARSRARLGKVKSILRGRSHQLVELEELIQGATIVSQHHLGTQTVCIHCIKGSEGRNTDFDCDFNPLKNMPKVTGSSCSWSTMRRSPNPIKSIISGLYRCECDDLGN